MCSRASPLTVYPLQDVETKEVDRVKIMHNTSHPKRERERDVIMRWLIEIVVGITYLNAGQNKGFYTTKDRNVD
jgi:hypothetical protein